MKKAMRVGKWRALAGGLAVLWGCGFFAPWGMAQDTAPTVSPNFELHDKNVATPNNTLTLAIGEVVTLDLKANGHSSTNINWELAHIKDGKTEKIRYVINDQLLRNKFATQPLQLFSTAIDYQGATDSENIYNDRATSYNAISTDNTEANNAIKASVFLKATKAIPAGSKYQVRLMRKGEEIPLRVLNVEVTQPPQVSLIPKNSNGEPQKAAKATNYSIEAGTARQFKLEVSPKSGGSIDLQEVFVYSSAPADLKVVDEDGEEKTKFSLKSNAVENIKVVALRDSEEPVKLTITNLPQNAGSVNEEQRIDTVIPFTIVRPKVSIQPPSVNLIQNSEAKVTVNLDTEDSGITPAGKIVWKSNNENIEPPKDTKNPYLIKSEFAGEATLKATYVLDPSTPPIEGVVLAASEAQLQVKVRPSPAIAVFDGPSTLLIGRTEKIKISLFDQAHRPVDEADRYRFTAKSTNSEVLAVRRHPELPGAVEVTALKPGVAQLIVVVDGVPLAETWELRAATVSEFKPVRVALNIMDDNTASDLFGKQTSQEFYAVRVRIFNNLDRDVDGRFLGKSILAYSESIEASVGLETKESPFFYDGKEKKKYENNVRELKRHQLGYLKKQIDEAEAELKTATTEEEKTKLHRRLHELNAALALRERTDFLDAWNELKTDDPRVTQNYDLPMANPENPYPFGLVTSTDAPYKKIGSALSSGTPARVGVAHPVQKIENARRLAFVLPEGISIPPGTAVHWWSENSSADAGPGNIITVDAGGVGIVNRTGLAMVSVIVGSKRYSRLIRVAAVPAAAANVSLLQVRLQPVSQVESGNNLAMTWADYKKPDPAPGTVDWRFFDTTDENKVMLSHNGDELFANGRINGTTAVVTTVGGEEYASVINVVLADPITQLSPSVYIDANGQPKYFQHLFRYRPYTFEMMVNSAPRRDSRESKTRKFNVLNGLLSAASLYSLINPGSTAQKVGLLSGLVPQLVKSQRPDLSDAQRQNFVSMTMKPLEEIPFGADISRVIFFPKTPFRGMVKDNITRINRIDTSYFNITVAILDKNTATYNAVLDNKRQ